MRSKWKINKLISATKSFSTLSWEAISFASETAQVHQVNILSHDMQIDNCWQEPCRIRDPKVLNKEETVIYQKNTHIQIYNELRISK